ncbi:MAG TPA: DUF4381 domain-containing protein [Woeseiaceae bacterium]|nr:DUF4381 domain-containing protein [Woeseiaceae bacterium]
MNPDQLPLRDLHLPDAVGWWPPAPGWWLLAVLVLAVLGRYLWQLVKAWRKSAARRAALAEYAHLVRHFRADGDVAALAQGLSALLRRAMLAYAPRQAVAGLTGDDWLHFLDRGLPRAAFSAGAGRELVTLPYRGREAARDVDADALLATVELRLKTPLPEERR